MTALWTVILVGGIVAAYVACARHLGRVTHGPTRHIHRPIVVADGTVDICDGCGELINR